MQFFPLECSLNDFTAEKLRKIVKQFKLEDTIKGYETESRKQLVIYLGWYVKVHCNSIELNPLWSQYIAIKNFYEKETEDMNRKERKELLEIVIKDLKTIRVVEGMKILTFETHPAFISYEGHARNILRI